MKIKTKIFIVLPFAIAGLLLSAHADDQPKPPTRAALRAAITKSLSFLAKGGDEWMAGKSVVGASDCNSCHHVPELLWSHREARLRGFAVDDKKFDEWLEWSDSHATEVGAGLEMTAFMKLAMPEKPAPELTQLIVKGQQPDGSWKPHGQFATMQKRDTAEAAENCTRIFLLSLGAQEEDKPASDGARTKAAAMLAKNDPPKSVETLVFRALFAQRFGTREDAAPLRGDILKLQHNDGGWSWWIAEQQSDALATGEVLYLLQPSPDAATAEAVARAQQWLLSTQSQDGSWSIDITHISKIDRSAPAKAKSFKNATEIYHYWGTAWAAIGLLQGVPPK